MPDSTVPPTQVASSESVRQVAWLYYGYDDGRRGKDRVIDPADVPLRAKFFYLADALDALRESVKGCGMIFDWGPCVGGDADAWLCPFCAAKRDTAISSLIGAKE